MPSNFYSTASTLLELRLFYTFLLPLCKILTRHAHSAYSYGFFLSHSNVLTSAQYSKCATELPTFQYASMTSVSYLAERMTSYFNSLSCNHVLPCNGMGPASMTFRTCTYPFGFLPAHCSFGVSPSSTEPPRTYATRTMPQIMRASAFTVNTTTELL